MRPTLLLVDDKPENIKLLFDVLKDTGYRTLAAVDGENAVVQAELARPDLILMDVMMPGMDGFTACERIKANPATRHIPIIFMTALADVSDKLRGFQAGGIDYLTKPLQHEEVLARIEAHLTHHRLWSDIDAYSRILLDMECADSLPDAWRALKQLLRTKPELACLALWTTSETGLRLSYMTGGAEKRGAGLEPDERALPVPSSEPLIETVFRDRQQVVAVDGSPLSAYPAWAAEAGLRGLIATPVCCRNDCFGVLLACSTTPFDTATGDGKRWHEILANSLGNAIFHVQSRDAIRDLSERLRAENAGLRSEVSQPSREVGSIIGQSPSFRRTLEQVDLVAPTDSTVLILGESGTGKERLAERIHAHSRRGDAPLIRVNCAAIPADLFESEFFGHVKGAFTGASKDRVGRFELADGGTLFLDEIGEIPLDLQGKLLRVLESGTFERVGEAHTRTTDIRLVAATNRDVQKAVAEGRFRADLYYRISVFPVTLPPLRERADDIPALTRHFIALTARKMGLPPPAINDAILAPFMDYPWPGNIRELQNEIERAMILSRGNPHVLSVPGQGAIPPPGSGQDGSEGRAEHAAIITEQDWQTLQHDNIVRALRRCDWRVDGPGGAAVLLGLRPTTLRSRMQSFRIQRPV